MNSGIYVITCLVNNKIYIGSSCNIRKRFENHKTYLRSNKHCNDYLQRSWNKYGENEFTFTVLEYVEDKFKLIEREQYWIDEAQCCNVEKGFNLCPKAGSVLGIKRKEETIKQQSKFWIVISPEGIESNICNLSRFCKQNNLNSSLMLTVAKGKADQHAKWHCRYVDFTMEKWKELRSKYKINRIKKLKMIREKRYKLRNPEGKIFDIINLTKFCRENKLCVTSLHAVNVGKLNQYKGWKCKKYEEGIEVDFVDKPRKKSTKSPYQCKDWNVTNPLGEKFEVNNLTKFCKENRLQSSCMVLVAQGKAIQHKGWICQYADASNWVQKIVKRGDFWKITSPDGKCEIIQSLQQFCNKNNISQSAMRCVARGTYKQCKGWKCEKVTK